MRITSFLACALFLGLLTIAPLAAASPSDAAFLASLGGPEVCETTPDPLARAACGPGFCAEQERECKTGCPCAIFKCNPTQCTTICSCPIICLD